MISEHDISFPFYSEPDNRTEDESSDLELDDEAYALKIEQEIGLGLPTEAEMQANQTTLYEWEKMKGDAREQGDV